MNIEKLTDKPNVASSKYRNLIILFALAGVIFVWASTNERGAGLSPDSVRYIGTARNILRGMGAVSYDDIPLVAEPPLYPALLALIGILAGADPLLYAHIVNSFLFGAIIYLGGWLFVKHLSSVPGFAPAATLAIVFSIPLFQVSAAIASEPLFICFLILSLIFAESYRTKNDITSLLLFSLTAALSSLTRYIGVTLILWGALIILVFYRDPIKKTLMRLGMFIAISTFPLGIWVIRNNSISGTFFGPRAPSGFTLSENLIFTFNGLLHWYFPPETATYFLILISILAGIGLFAGRSAREGWQYNKSIRQEIGVSCLFTVIYIVFLIISSTTTAFDRIEDRLLSPVYVPLTLIALIAIQKLASLYQKSISKRVLGYCLLIGLTIWLIYPIQSTIKEAIYLSQNGSGYNSNAWAESETIRYLLQDRTLATDCGALYSNAADAVYILTSLFVRSSPAEKFYNSSEKINTVSELKGLWPEEPSACLIWLNKVERTHLFSIEEINRIANLEIIARFEDGAIYAVTKK